MRLVETFPADALQPLRRTAERDIRFASWIEEEVIDALASRSELEGEWRDALRRYEQVPKQRQRDSPVENAPNVEVALGAIAADALYAQFIDTIFNIAPVITIRPTSVGEAAMKAASALQRRVDHGVTSEWNFRQAIETFALDVVQLGTGVIHIPWMEHLRKTDLMAVTTKGAWMDAWPLEDVLVQGGARQDIQRLPWVALRAWYTPGEVALWSRRAGWDTTGWEETSGQDWVRSQRETLGRSKENKHRTHLYETFHLYCHYDYDDDGIEEDLYAVWDRASSNLGLVRYNPYDHRPVEAGRYQLRPYLFYGMGVLEMSKTAQETVTELMNAALLNVALSNVGIIAVGQSVDDAQRLWAGKLVRVANPTEDFVPKKLAEPHPATATYIATNISLLERRVGINDMSTPRPSAVMGSRTPGITTMSLLQQVNKRFTPAFDQMRLAGAGAVRQCLFREQERLLAGDTDLEDMLRRLLGPEDGQAVIDLLRDPDFDEQMVVELTASSASVNREADKQSSLMLVQVLGQYYEKSLELINIASNPQVPEPVRKVAAQIATSANAIIERTIRTFDIARDPRTFLVDINAELDAMPMDPTAMAGLASMLGMLGGQPGGPEGANGMPMEGEALPEAPSDAMPMA